MNFITKKKRLERIIRQNREKEASRATKILLNTLDKQNNLLTTIKNNSNLLNESFLKMAKAILEQSEILEKVVHTVTDYFSIQTEILQKEAKEHKEETPEDSLY